MVERPKTVAAAVAVFGLVLAGCDLFPAETAVDDARLAPLWLAAKAFDRERYGFSPLPAVGTVGWEKDHGGPYDAMLHQSGRTYRTIAFVKIGHRYRWIGEQESFEGPGVFHTPDGDEHERITLTYETVAVSGAPLNRLYIVYNGEDRRLAWPATLTSADVEPVLAEWGYRSPS